MAQLDDRATPARFRRHFLERLKEGEARQRQFEISRQRASFVVEIVFENKRSFAVRKPWPENDDVGRRCAHLA